MAVVSKLKVHTYIIKKSSSKSKMEIKSHLNEDLFHRQLWDPVRCYPALEISQETGVVAIMTKSTVQIQTFQFEYMGCYRANWLSIEKGAGVGIEPYMSKHSIFSVDEWLQRNSIKERVDVKNVQWCKYIRDNNDWHPLLAVLLTNGNLLLVGCNSECGSQCGVHSLSSYPWQLKLHGLSVIFDCTNALHKKDCPTETLLQKERENRQDVEVEAEMRCIAESFRSQVCCFTEHYCSLSGCVFMVLASVDEVTVWSVCQIPSMKFQFIARIALANNLKSNSRDRSQITCLTSLPANHTDKDKKELISVVAGTSSGDLLLLRFLIDQNCCDCMQKLHICDFPIEGVSNHNSSGSSQRSSSALRVIAGSSFFIIPISELKSSVRIIFADATAGTETTATSAFAVEPGMVAKVVVNTNISATVSVPNVSRINEVVTATTADAAVTTNTTSCVVVAAMSGDLSVWTTSATDQHVYQRLPDIKSSTGGLPIFGLATDSIGLICAFLHKTPSVHANCREVQLNSSLRSIRSKLGWVLSPCVPSDFAVSATSTSLLLLHIINNKINSNNTLSFLPLAYLLSLDSDACRTHYRQHITDLKEFIFDSSNSKVRSDDSNMKNEENCGYKDVDDDNDDSDDDCSDGDGESGDENKSDNSSGEEEGEGCETSDSEQSAVVRRRKIKRKEKAYTFNFTKSQTKRNQFTQKKSRRFSTMDAFYERINQLQRPSKSEIVALSVPTLFDAAVLAALAIQQGRICSENLISGKETDEKIAILFTIPSANDVDSMDRIVMLWRCLHVMIMACHRVRGVQKIAADWEFIPASLRQVMHICYCIRGLQRFERNVSGAGEKAEDSQTAYLMSVVVEDYVERTHPEDMAVLTSLVSGVRKLLIARSSNRSSGRCDNSDRSGSSGRWTESTLGSVLGTEICGVCFTGVRFSCTPTESSSSAEDIKSEFSSADDGADAGPGVARCFGVKLPAGGSVLYSTCSGCGVKVERCCFSLRLITTPPDHHREDAVPDYSEAHSDTLYACPVCDSVTNTSLSCSVTPPASVIRGDAVASLLCPYCQVIMLPI